MSVCPVPVSPPSPLSPLHCTDLSVTLHNFVSCTTQPCHSTTRNDRLLLQWTVPCTMQCYELNIGSSTLCSKSWRQSTSLHSTCRVAPALSLRLLLLFINLLCNVHSAKHTWFAQRCICVLQSGNSLSFGVFLDRLLLSRVTYSTTYYPLLWPRTVVHNVTKGRTSIRNREQQAQRELESFCAGKKCGLAQTEEQWWCAEHKTE